MKCFPALPRLGWLFFPPDDWQVSVCVNSVLMLACMCGFQWGRVATILRVRVYSGALCSVLIWRRLQCRHEGDTRDLRTFSHVYETQMEPRAPARMHILTQRLAED